MKGKKVSLVERCVSKSTESLFKRYSQKKRNKRTNRDRTQSALSQKNANFLKNHRNTFKAYSLQKGDSGESFFKKSLRNYEKPVAGCNLKWLDSGTQKNLPRTENKDNQFTVTQYQENSAFEADLLESEPSYTSGFSESSTSIITIMAGEDGGDEVYFEEGEDELDNLVNKIQEEMEQVMDENPELQETLANAQEEGGGEEEGMLEVKYVEPSHEKEPVSDRSRGAYSLEEPKDDAAILKRLEEVEAEAVETSKLINAIKERVAELLKKPKMTNEDSQELMEKNQMLKDLMQKFDDLTKLIELLMDKSNMGKMDVSSLTSSTTEVTPKKIPEDTLPKVIICGATENNMPKIIICDAEKFKRDRKSSLTIPANTAIPQFARKLSDSYNMQSKLASENADLEVKRYQLQEDLINKDQAVESLQRKLCGLQAEMRIVLKENNSLSSKLQLKEKKSKKKMSCGGKRTICPADVENRLMEYSNTTQLLEQQMGQMEMEMRNMQTELQTVQRERQQLRMRCGPQPRPPCPAPCAPRPCEQQLRELREQYNRLQDDFKAKLTEVAGLRADTERWKSAAALAEEAKKAMEDKLKDADKNTKTADMKSHMLNSKEMLFEQEQQLNIAKKRFREAQDELEEVRALVQDQDAQLEDYRNKYLQAQQQVDEQRRQIDLMELENSRIAEQVNLEISRVKNHFQEKLQELTPLPDLLKATQLKLQEAQQMHILAERNNETMMREVHAQREKAQALQCQLDQFMDDAASGADSQGQLMSKMDEYQKKFNDLKNENEQLKADLAKMEELADQNEKLVQEKLHEIAQLVAQLDMVREESARHVARTKDRCETVRRSMQNQISDLERQLAQSRAAACSAQKERDDIRQKMQMQINNLNDNFEEAQVRIRNLQGHVNFLKTSYTNIFSAGECGPGGPPPSCQDEDPCNCGNNY